MFFFFLGFSALIYLCFCFYWFQLSFWRNFLYCWLYAFVCIIQFTYEHFVVSNKPTSLVCGKYKNKTLIWIRKILSHAIIAITFDLLTTTPFKLSKFMELYSFCLEIWPKNNPLHVVEHICGVAIYRSQHVLKVKYIVFKKKHDIWTAALSNFIIQSFWCIEIGIILINL